MKKIILTISFLFLLNGCATMRVTSYYPEKKFSPTDPEKILILNTAPLKEHSVIGQVTLASLTYSERELRRKVADMGGNAVIFDSLAISQPLVEYSRQEVTVGPEGKVITHSQPRIHAERNTQIVAKIIRFQEWSPPD